jgi:CheY-like chemotaxis protein
MMPNVDGFAFLHRLRSEEFGREVPVLVVTAMELDTEQRERLRQQVAAVLPKSALRGNELISQVLHVLRISDIIHRSGT